MADNKVKQNGKLTGQKIQATPKPKKEIGADTDGTFVDQVLDGVQTSSINAAALQGLNQVAQSRENIFTNIDAMAADSTISAALEIYAEDTVEPNDKGDIIWCESSNADIASYVTFLIKSFKLDKSAFKHAYTMYKYGDVYLRLYRESDVKNAKDAVEAKGKKLNESKDKIKDILKEIHEDEEREILESIAKDDTLSEEAKKKLKEDLIVHAHAKKGDHYVTYVEMMPNPAEWFDAQQFGRNMGYLKAPVQSMNKDNKQALTQFSYKYKSNDITIFDSTDMVHASLESTSDRVPEEIELFNDNNVDDKKAKFATYTVKRGQSILYNSFKIWRELTLLENSILLNRLTKSSIIRILNVNCGTMSKEQSNLFVQRLKDKIEQKMSVNVGSAADEYTNPGPVENIIYIPTHGEQGTINSAQLGDGQVDPKQLTDLEYFRDKLFGNLKIPKQYLGHCLRGDTPVLLLNGKTITIKDMFEHKDDYVGKGIMACNTDGSLCPTKITDVSLTKLSSDFIRIHLDNGKYVDVTDDHRMMLRDGTFVEASDIKVGDSLMPYYDKLGTNKLTKGRRLVLDNKEGKYKKQYRVVAESMFGDIPSGYQIHHKDKVKINDDFNNLECLSLQEHYNEHHNDLVRQNKEAYRNRKDAGIPANANVNSRIINNGLYETWLKEGEVLPEGFEFGRLPFSNETISKMSKARKDRLLEHPEELEKLINHEITEEVHNKLSASAKKMWKSLSNEQLEQIRIASRQRMIRDKDKLLDTRMKQYEFDHPGRVRHERYLRCPICGKVFVKKIFDCEYEAYLKKEQYFYCSEEHKKLINGAGKLGRSYKLFNQCDNNFEVYADARLHQESRADTYYYADTLKSIYNQYLEAYVPECNHKVVKLERLDVDEPAYDISVAADCHTFALPCGIFVHNCDDNAGFSGGTSLALISSRYAKSIKRGQATLCQLYTDLINFVLVDRGLDAYVNKFTIRMQTPLTQEEKDKKEAAEKSVGYVSGVMGLLNDIPTPSAVLRIKKSLLSNIVSNPEVIDIIEEEIQKLEAQEKGENETEDEGPKVGPRGKEDREEGEEPEVDKFAGFENDVFGGENKEETPAEEPASEEEPYLPTADELGADMTDNEGSEEK